MAANEVLARVAERRVLRPAGFHRSYRQRLFVEHYLGKSSGSAVLPRAELGINGLKARAATGLEKSEKRGVQAARNGPSADGKCLQRVERGIHGLNRWAVSCLEMSRKRGVQAARNGPSADVSLGSALSWVPMD
jgi:hypothetical protein